MGEMTTKAGETLHHSSAREVQICAVFSSVGKYIAELTSAAGLSWLRPAPADSYPSAREGSARRLPRQRR